MRNVQQNQPAFGHWIVWIVETAFYHRPLEPSALRSLRIIPHCRREGGSNSPQIIHNFILRLRILGQQRFTKHQYLFGVQLLTGRTQLRPSNKLAANQGMELLLQAQRISFRCRRTGGGTLARLARKLRGVKQLAHFRFGGPGERS